MSPMIVPRLVKMDIDYFISYFTEVAEDGLIRSDEVVDNRSGDAWEWLLEDEADTLFDLVRPFGILLLVNDGIGEWGQYGKTPKERVLKFLHYVKHCWTQGE